MTQFQPAPVRVLLPLLALCLGLTVAACDTTGSDSDDATGRLTVLLTDTPANLESAIVTIRRIDLVPEDAEDGEDGDEDDESEILRFPVEERPIDLLQLQDGVTTTLADVDVPAGEYEQIRLVLGDENYVVADGERQDLQVPSGQESGIKILLPDEVEVENDGDRIELTLDFDVHDSFVLQGNGRYLFKPTVRVQEVQINGDAMDMVSVEGAVTSVDAENGQLVVEDVVFETTGRTEFDDLGSLADLDAGDFVEVEGVVEDGRRIALEVEREDEDEERSITARLEQVSSSSVTLLGVTIAVNAETDVDDGDLDDLEDGDRVEVEFVIRSDGSRLATEIDREESDDD
jgi:hypothetical protein